VTLGNIQFHFGTWKTDPHWTPYNNKVAGATSSKELSCNVGNWHRLPFLCYHAYAQNYHRGVHHISFESLSLCVLVCAMQTWNRVTFCDPVTQPPGNPVTQFYVWCHVRALKGKRPEPYTWSPIDRDVVHGRPYRQALTLRSKGQSWG